MTNWIFVMCAASGVLTAYYLKFRFSGANYRKLLTIALVFTNSACAFFYIELTQNDCVLFFKCFPDLTKSHPVIEWVALACIFLHCFAIPTEWEPKRLFRIRRKVL